jgi:hypothetical protein
MFPRFSLLFYRTDILIGSESIESGKKALFTYVVHVVADGGDCVVLPCGSVEAASARRPEHHHTGAALADDVQAGRVVRVLHGLTA